ncbi:MAG: NnrU family protein [Rhodospirillales bacterium]|nr:MAG: NnrU family protein [Rhodospirillales bacterium]
MVGAMEMLVLAVACFVGGHFLLSSLSARTALVRMLGETGFRAGYSLIALLTLIWAIVAYGEAPYAEIWPTTTALLRVPYLLMPWACVLGIAGLTTRSVTMVGGEAAAQNPRPVSGITTVTRHPFLWGVTLWAACHIAANGDVASVVFFGGMAVLALGGMAHIDHRRRVSLGADWGPVALATSVVPFAAAIQGRVRIDWHGIGWARLAGGIVLAIVLAVLHPWISGKAIIPVLALPAAG